MKMQAYSIQQTTDGGYIVAGYELSPLVLEYDMWILKLDAMAISPGRKPTVEVVMNVPTPSSRPEMGAILWRVILLLWGWR